MSHWVIASILLALGVLSFWQNHLVSRYGTLRPGDRVRIRAHYTDEDGHLIRPGAEGIVVGQTLTGQHYITFNNRTVSLHRAAVEKKGH